VYVKETIALLRQLESIAESEIKKLIVRFSSKYHYFCYPCGILWKNILGLGTQGKDIGVYTSNKWLETAYLQN